ncbi:MAG: hypothetical protein WC538_00590 [Thermoanaerobaculia bacterium]
MAAIAIFGLTAFGQSGPPYDGSLFAQPPSDRGEAGVVIAPANENPETGGRIRPVRIDQSLFVHPPADLSGVAVVVPLGNVNAVAGGHVRPVNHMYLEYLDPRGGGAAALDVDAMAVGEIVLVFHQQSEACVLPDASVPGGCATGPGATATIDDYQIFIRHTDSLTVSYDHLHALDAGLGLPDWRDEHAGWVRLGSSSMLFLGSNGALPPVSVTPGQRMGETRNYSTSWDIGVIDTRRTRYFLGTGLLRYPTLPQFFEALAASGVTLDPLGPGQPFPGEAFVNSACFIDYLTRPLATAWRAKLAGDGSCGRPDWDVVDTLQGNWYRADITEPTLENMFATEESAISFSAYNYDPANQTQIGFGENFFAMAPATADPTAVAAARERTSHGLRFVTDRTSGTRHNPDPATVHTSDYACYDLPDRQGGPGHPLPPGSMVTYLPIADGEVHLKLRYFATSCAERLAAYQANPGLLDDAAAAWWGDYVR